MNQNSKKLVGGGGGGGESKGVLKSNWPVKCSVEKWKLFPTSTIFQKNFCKVLF